jgi:hypothetical protein
MYNFINPAYSQLMIVGRIFNSCGTFQEQRDKILYEAVIDAWIQADQHRDQPRELLRLFGEGLSLFLALPDYIRNFEIKPGLSAFGVHTKNALTEAFYIAEKNRIRVNFTLKGAVFS